ncbi:hypothetical protein VULLAG_LOCUS21118 [Vulpes lagopus]
MQVPSPFDHYTVSSSTVSSSRNIISSLEEMGRRIFNRLTDRMSFLEMYLRGCLPSFKGLEASDEFSGNHTSCHCFHPEPAAESSGCRTERICWFHPIFPAGVLNLFIMRDGAQQPSCTEEFGLGEGKERRIERRRELGVGAGEEAGGGATGGAGGEAGEGAGAVAAGAAGEGAGESAGGGS